MSEDAFQAFQARLQSDPSLQQALAAAAEAYAQAVVAIAAEAGFSISVDQVQAAQRSQLPDALSDDDLDGVVGGAIGPGIRVWSDLGSNHSPTWVVK